MNKSPETTYEEYCDLLKFATQVLSRYFGWTFQTVGDMTMEQIHLALEIVEKVTKASENSGQPGLDGNLHFSTVEQWKAWRELR